MPVLDPRTTYLHIARDWEANRIPVDDRFRETIGQRSELHHGCLLTGCDTSSDFGHWEMHPEGDEVLISRNDSAFAERADRCARQTENLREDLVGVLTESRGSADLTPLMAPELER